MSSTIWLEMESGRDSGRVVHRHNGYSSGNHGAQPFGTKATQSISTTAPRANAEHPTVMRPGGSFPMNSA